MSCFTELTIEFEHTLYQVDIKEDDTILDLKKSIYLATQLEPSRQIFCNLFLPASNKEPDNKLQQLNLEPEFILKIIDELNESPETENKENNQPARPSFALCEGAFKTISNPREKLKLLILDIDRTIYDHDSTSIVCASRPHLQEFLKSIYLDYNIGIWSATEMEIIEKKVNTLGMINNPNYKILCLMDVNAMIDVNVGIRTVNVKSLKAVWETYPQFNKENTLICDDQRINFVLNPRNGIQVVPYRYQNYATDKELLHLLHYLKQIAQYDDLTTINHRFWKKYNSCNENSHSCSLRDIHNDIDNNTDSESEYEFWTDTDTDKID